MCVCVCRVCVCVCVCVCENRNVIDVIASAHRMLLESLKVVTHRESLAKVDPATRGVSLAEPRPTDVCVLFTR